MGFEYYEETIQQRKCMKPTQFSATKNTPGGNFMIFKEVGHSERYEELLARMNGIDEYHRMAAYIMALIPWIREDDVFDFERDCIRPQGILADWQTQTSRAATRLMFSLWNGCWQDVASENPEKTSMYYTPDSIFCSSRYLPYFFEAIRIMHGLVDIHHTEIK